MRSTIINICIVAILTCTFSACHSPKYYYLHFNDKKHGFFYCSAPTIVESTDTCIVSGDTLRLILSKPALQEGSFKGHPTQYYSTYIWASRIYKNIEKNRENRYVEKIPFSTYPYNQYYSYIKLENYYCTRIFKRKNGSRYVQVSSIEFSSHVLEIP